MVDDNSVEIKYSLRPMT